MRKRNLVMAALILAAASGCGENQEEKVVGGNKELNLAAAERVTQAQSLDDLKSILQDYGQKKQALMRDAAAKLSRDQLSRLGQRLEKETASSALKLERAFANFQERLKKTGPNPKVVIDTSRGPITVQLFEGLAPHTVKNFLQYVDDKFYDGTIFHRVMPGFMIQGGGFETGMKEKPVRPPIPNESFNGLSNIRGTIAMARTDKPDSATAQFYINLVDNRPLDRVHAKDGVGYAVFGEVLEGMDVVDKIAEAPTNKRGDHENVPVEDMIIKSVRRVESKK